MWLKLSRFLLLLGLVFTFVYFSAEKVVYFSGRPTGTKILKKRLAGALDLPEIAVCYIPAFNETALGLLGENLTTARKFYDMWHRIMSVHRLTEAELVSMYLDVVPQAAEILEDIYVTDSDDQRTSIMESRVDSVKPAAGECPTFRIPENLTDVRHLYLVFKTPSDEHTKSIWSIYCYSRGLFYSTDNNPGIENIYIQKGEYVKTFLRLEKQVLLAKKGLYKDILTDQTDCEDTPGYSWDYEQSQHAFAHQLKQQGCLLPYWSGVTKGHRLCTDPHMYKKEVVFSPGILKALEKAKPPCTKTYLNYGIIHRLPAYLYDNQKVPKGVLKITFPAEIDVQEQYVTFDSGDLISSVGGYLGLFLGVSLMELYSILKYSYTLVLGIVQIRR